jgi:hypothetical protein
MSELNTKLASADVSNYYDSICISLPVLGTLVKASRSFWFRYGIAAF